MFFPLGACRSGAMVLGGLLMLCTNGALGGGVYTWWKRVGWEHSNVAPFLAGVLTAKYVGWRAKRRHERMRMQAALAQVIEEADGKLLRRIIGDLPLWVTAAEFQRVAWLNGLISSAWPSVADAVSVQVGASLKETFSKLRIPGLRLTLDRFAIGTLPPKFGGVRLAHSDRDHVTLDFNFKWGGDPDICITARSGLVAIPVRLAALQVFGTVRVVIYFVKQMPVVGAVSVSTLGKPDISFVLEVSGGDVLAIPGLEGKIDNIIKNVIGGILAWPKRIHIPLVEGAGPGEESIAGVLYAKIKRASDLPVMDITGFADPYVSMYVRDDRVHVTAEKSNTLNPVWEEMHQFIVDDAETQELVLEVIDADDLDTDDKIGKIKVPISALDPGKVVSRRDALELETGVGKRKSLRAGKYPVLEYELLYVPYNATNLDVSLPSGWTLPPSGVLTVEIQVGRGIHNQRSGCCGPERSVVVQVNCGVFEQKTKAGVQQGNGDFVWEQSMDFAGVDADVNPIVEFTVLLRSSRRKFGTMGKMIAARDITYGNVKVPINDIIENGGRMQKTYHLDNAKTGQIDLELKYTVSEVIRKIRIAST